MRITGPLHPTKCGKETPGPSFLSGLRLAFQKCSHVHSEKGCDGRGNTHSHPPTEGALPNFIKVKGAQSCPTLCDPMDYTVHGILQVIIPKWVAFPFSRGSSQPRDQTQVSRTAGGFFTS